MTKIKIMIIINFKESKSILTDQHISISRLRVKTSKMWASNSGNFTKSEIVKIQLFYSQTKNARGREMVNIQHVPQSERLLILETSDELCSPLDTVISKGMHANCFHGNHNWMSSN